MSSKRFMQVVGLVGTTMLLACALDPIGVTQDVPGQQSILDTLTVDPTALAPAWPGGSGSAQPTTVRDGSILH